jgi:ABC-type lipoprotein export system ATPase subunit
MNDSKGSLWRKWDLHVHTPASFHWKGQRFAEMKPEEELAALNAIADKMSSGDVAAYGIMDYWTFDGYLRLRRYLAKEKRTLPCTVFPGMELRIEAPVDFRLNIQVVLSDQLSDQQLANFRSALLVNKQPLSDEALVQFAQSLDPSKAKVHSFSPEDLKDPAKLLALGSMTAKVTRESLDDAIALLPEKSCLIVIPYDTFNGIADLDWEKHPYDDNYFMRSADIFETRAQENVDLIQGVETDKNRKFIANFQKTMGRPAKPVISGSDAHRVQDYGAFPSDRITWLKADPTFTGLLQTINEPRERCYIGVIPPKLAHVGANRTKFIRSLTLRKRAGSTLGEHWFSAEIPLNHDLVAIIGNKGQGKSALAEPIGLAGSTRQHGAFSFLAPKNFCNPKQNKAAHYEITLLWESGTVTTCPLDAKVDETKPELVKFIPQNFLENICNQIGLPNETDFDRELRKVIFSHVDAADQLGQPSLDALIAHKTEETKTRIAQIQKQVVLLNRAILALELKLEPEYRQSLESQLFQRNEELKSHRATRPATVQKPDLDPATQQAVSAVATEINAKKTERDTSEATITGLRARQQALAIGISSADKLLAKFDNLERTFTDFEKQCAADLAVLGLPFADLAKLNVNRTPLHTKRTQLNREKETLEGQLDPTAVGNLIGKLETLKKEIVDLQGKLDEPNKKYQEFLAAEEVWQKRETALIGTAADAGSITQLETEIAGLAGIAPTLAEQRAQRLAKAMEIHREISGLAKAYRDLYAPVQKFISERTVTREKFNLNFSVSIVDAGFEERFFNYISHGVAGTFCGVEDGTKMLRSILAKHDLNTEAGATAFLTEISAALEADLRPGFGQPSRKAQLLKKGRTQEELYDFIFSLDFLSPRYGLKMAEKELYQLSPGERGTMLLVFYLMVDKGDIPLLIDQPEENLDNQTVFELLVPCIKYAKCRRQIIIVTHNPNLAVVCDAEQVVFAKLDKRDGYRLTYTSGAIENPVINRAIVDVLEGTRPAFDNRDAKYLPLPPA